MVWADLGLSFLMKLTCLQKVFILLSVSVFLIKIFFLK